MGTVFLAAYLDLATWFVFVVLLAMAGVGLIMKTNGWPRPPLILGFILGPIVEQNLQSALSIYGLRGVLTRPIAIGIFLFLIVSVVTLLRMQSSSPQVVVAGGEEDALVGSDIGRVDQGSVAPAGGGTTGSGLADLAAPETFVPRWRDSLLGRENLAPLFFIVVAVAFMIPSFGFNSEARLVPLSTSLALLFFSLYVLIKQTVTGHAQQGEIMDLGMRSTEMDGALRSGAMIAGLFGLFFVLAGLIGIQYAAVVFSTIGPVVFLEGRLRWISALTSGGFVFLFSEFIMFQILGVIWPDPYILSWLGLV
jgi:hypothetical protein